MSKKAYIGIPTEIPVYGQGEIAITSLNINEYFDVSYDQGDCMFHWVNDVLVSNMRDKIFTSESSNIQPYAFVTSVSILELIAKKNIENFSFYVEFANDATNGNSYPLILYNVTEDYQVEINYNNYNTISLSAGEIVQFIHNESKYATDVDYVNLSGLKIIGEQTVVDTYTQEIARNVSNIYIGVPTEVPIYVGNSDDVSLTSENIDTYFDVTFSGESNTFQWINNVLVSDFENPAEPLTYSDIQAFAIRPPVSRLSLIAKKQLQFAFNVDFNSELSTLVVEPEGPLEIYINDAEPIGIHSNQSLSYTLNEGDSIVIVHNMLGGTPYVSLSNLNILSDKEIIGTYIESRAHKVIKAYVGVNGVARQWYSVPTFLIDFEYTNNYNNTYTLTAWKETLNGEPSTELIVPDNNTIIL